MVLAKPVVVAFISNACGKDGDLRRTYRQMGLPEFLRMPCSKTDPAEVLSDLICHLCLDEGVFNGFSDPIAVVMPRTLQHFGHSVDIRRAKGLLDLLQSGDADPKSVTEAVRSLIV